MNAILITTVLSFVISSSVMAGNTYRPLTSDSPSANTAKSLKKMTDQPWFPETLSVVISNRTVSYVSHVPTYKYDREHCVLTKLTSGTLLTFCDPKYKEVKFKVSSVNTNMVTLEILGTLKQKKIPLDIVENLTPAAQ